MSTKNIIIFLKKITIQTQVSDLGRGFGSSPTSFGVYAHTKWRIMLETVTLIRWGVSFKGYLIRVFVVPRWLPKSFNNRESRSVNCCNLLLVCVKSAQ